MQNNLLGLPSFVRHLAYNRSVRAIVRAVGLSWIARKVYCFLTPGITLNSTGVSANLVTSADCNIELLDFVVDAEKDLLHEVLRRLEPTDVFWDVGAQWGIYAIPAAKLARRAVAFEPFPASNATLRLNVERNHISNIMIFDFALSDQNGEVYLLHAENTCPTVSEKGDLAVEAARGDDLIAAGSVPAPTVIKVDVEGHEFAVLKGICHALSSSSCHLVACEIHPQLLPQGVTKETIVSLLCDCGLAVVSEFHRGPEFQIIAARKTVQST
jgi:FkbM family methyltransferase